MLFYANMLNNYDLGKTGENSALEYYLSQNFTLVSQNFQFYKNGVQGRLGEIDLIMEKAGRLHLIEVKTRSDNKYGLPIEQINRSKLKHLYKTYLYFILKNKKYANYFCQFDVASVIRGNVSVISNAYSFEGIAGNF